jgi:hypothetical protein
MLSPPYASVDILVFLYTNKKIHIFSLEIENHVLDYSIFHIEKQTYIDHTKLRL